MCEKVQIHDGRHCNCIVQQKLSKGTARTLNEFFSLSWPILPLTWVRRPLTWVRMPLDNECRPLQVGLPVQESSPLLAIFFPTCTSPSSTFPTSCTSPTSIIPTSTSPASILPTSTSHTSTFATSAPVMLTAAQPCGLGVWRPTLVPLITPTTTLAASSFPSVTSGVSIFSPSVLMGSSLPRVCSVPISRVPPLARTPALLRSRTADAVTTGASPAPSAVPQL